MKKLGFPRVSVPDVTIIVVTYGAGSWVRRCLRAVIDRTEPCYEVIVVDNASPRGMADRLSRQIENARLLANPVNRGFGPANNQAANFAKGSFLVFLNSDAVVHTGWLSFLRERIESHPRVGAAAPRILNLDGTLQEAGALLYSNGYTQFYGFGADPERPEYRFPREVDYASAACLMVRRRAFFEVGGFDAVYAPAYYEDVDVCLNLRERGYRILYEPRAVVTHARGASSSRGLARKLWQRNQPVFYGRWKERLASHPEYTPPDGNRRLQIAARDAAVGAKILLVTDRLPRSAERPGGAGALAPRLGELYPGCLRTIVSAETAEGSNDRLADLGWEVSDRSALEERPFHYDVVIFESAMARDAFEELIAETQPQAARFSGEDLSNVAAALGAVGIPPGTYGRRRPLGSD